jgi:hypothetical protein
MRIMQMAFIQSSENLYCTSISLYVKCYGIQCCCSPNS